MAPLGHAVYKMPGINKREIPKVAPLILILPCTYV